MLIFALTAVTIVSSHDQGQASYTLDGYAVTQGAEAKLRLPRRLREISGLTFTQDNRLFAHNDEQAVIYEIDYHQGRLRKAFALGEVTAKGDFEGIAVADGRFFLVTSNGWLYEAREGNDGDRVLYSTHGTPVGRRCEVEGLAYEPTDHVLLLACKTPRIKALERYVTVFRWSLETRSLAADSVLTFPLEQFTGPLNDDEFRPSGIARHPTTGNYFLVSARQTAVAEVSRDGEVIAVRKLRGRDHRQVEGIAFDTGGTAYMADEGRRRQGGQIASYLPRPKD